MKSSKLILAMLVLAGLSANANADAYAQIGVGTGATGTGEANVGFAIIEGESHTLNFEVTGSKVALKATQGLFGGTIQPAQPGTPATATTPGTPATPAQLVPFAPTANGLTGNPTVTYANKLGGALVFKGQVSDQVSFVVKGGLQSYKVGNTATAGTTGGILGISIPGVSGGFLGKALGENGIEPVVSFGVDYHLIGKTGPMLTARMSMAPSQENLFSLGIGQTF